MRRQAQALGVELASGRLQRQRFCLGQWNFETETQQVNAGRETIAVKLEFQNLVPVNLRYQLILGENTPAQQINSFFELETDIF